MSEFGDDLHHHDALVRRLRAMGSQPVDPVVAARHAALMRSASPEELAPHRRFRPVLVGGLVAGALFGSVGLAGALTGNVPAPARAVLETVGLMDDGGDDADTTKVTPAGQVDAPELEGGPGLETQVTPGERGVERVPCDGFTGTHGQWVAVRPDDPATEVNERSEAARAECGKPVPSTEHPRSPQPQENPGRGNPGGPRGGGGPPAATGSGDTGRPPTAGRPPGVGTGAASDGAPGPPSAPGNGPAGAGAGKGAADP
jgi:hypothetical protein